MREGRMRWIVWLVFALASFTCQAQTVREYTLAPGDQIKVQVFQNPDLLLETRVSENGAITYPLVGVVHVGGKTLDEASRTIADALTKGQFIRDPQVSVQLMQGRGNQVTVLGFVARPG